jgi:hypothetical protein
MTNEDWRPVKGTPGYEISSLGRVGSWLPQRNHAPKPTIRRILSSSTDKDGYKKVVLHVQGKKIYKRVCRLVAEAWHENPQSFPEVRHLDGINTNDFPHNLAWGTSQQNAEDRINHGTQLKGSQINTSKLTEDIVREIKKSKEGHSALARKYGTTPGAIWHIRAGKTWKDVSP